MPDSDGRNGSNGKALFRSNSKTYCKEKQRGQWTQLGCQDLASSGSLGILLVLLLLTACSYRQHYPYTKTNLSPTYQSCLKTYRTFQRQTHKTNTQDTQYHQLKHYPQYRSNRHLASYANELTTEQQHQDWLHQLSTLANQKNQTEWQKLTSQTTTTITPEQLKHCNQQMLKEDLKKPTRLKHIKKQAQIKDNYRELHKILGLYPITTLFLKQGIKTLHEESKTTFNQPQKITTQYIPQQTNLTTLTPKQTQQIMHKAYQTNTLGIPTLTKTDLQKLYTQHTPIIQTTSQNHYDEIGELTWDNNNELTVNTKKPTIYQHTTYTRFEGNTLLQLNYLHWYPERPPEHWLDIYSGKLDGVIWRVTLDTTGQPLLYDSMHMCGCYHKYYNDPKKLKTKEKLPPEPPLIHNLTNQKPTNQQRPTITISTKHHYITSVTFSPPPHKNQQTYQTQPTQTLNKLPTQTTQLKSIYKKNNLIPKTQRKERWLYWPSGVKSAGQMRQWNHHAMTFIGEQHFDTPHLLETTFKTNE